MFTFLYEKFTQDNMYQILLQSVRFCRLHIKNHFGVFFGSQCSNLNNELFTRNHSYLFSNIVRCCYRCQGNKTSNNNKQKSHKTLLITHDVNFLM